MSIITAGTINIFGNSNNYLVVYSFSNEMIKRNKLRNLYNI